MKQLRELHDAARKLIRLIKPEGEAMTAIHKEVEGAIKSAGDFLEQEKSFEYSGKLKMYQTGTAIKLVDASMDLDDIIRAIFSTKGEIATDCELSLVIYLPAKEQPSGE